MNTGYHVDFNPTAEANVITPPFVNKTENRKNEKFVCEGSSNYPVTPTINFVCTQCGHHFHVAAEACTVLITYPDMMGYIVETYSYACPHCHKIVEAEEIF